MMGLEPTTFCMASGRGVVSERDDNRMAERKQRPTWSVDRLSEFPAFPGDSVEFGHRKRSSAQSIR